MSSRLLFPLRWCKCGVSQQSPVKGWLSNGAVQGSSVGMEQRLGTELCLLVPGSTRWALLASSSLGLSPVGQFSPEQVKRIELTGTGWFPRTKRRLYMLALISYWSQSLLNERKIDISSSPIMKLYISDRKRGIHFFTCSGEWNTP